MLLLLIMERTVAAPPPPIEAAAGERAEVAAAAVLSAVPTASTSLRPVAAATLGLSMPAPGNGGVTPWRCVTMGAGGPEAGVGAGVGRDVELWPSKKALATTEASTRKVSPTCAARQEHSLRPRKGAGGGGERKGRGGGRGGQRRMSHRRAALG